MYREFKFAPEEYYHIYNRGTDKREIFTNEKDYERFIQSLYLFNSEERIVLKMISKKDRFSYEREETLVDIGAYCLMSNHFHLLVRAKNDEGVSSFMKKLQTSYSMYFNKKYERNGSLFQGPFKAEHVGRDEYLKYLFAYIHLNPIKIIDPEWKENGIADMSESKNYLNLYKHSSYIDYLVGGRQEANILNKAVFPEYFEEPKVFDDFINFWLTFKNRV
ncbi:MAG: transposase [Patescibacteria group bacterium]